MGASRPVRGNPVPGSTKSTSSCSWDCDNVAIIPQNQDDHRACRIPVDAAAPPGLGLPRLLRDLEEEPRVPGVGGVASLPQSPTTEYIRVADLPSASALNRQFRNLDKKGSPILEFGHQPAEK